MTSSSPNQIASTSRWKKYCAEYDAFFDRHLFTYAGYTFCALFTFFVHFSLLWQCDLRLPLASVLPPFGLPPVHLAVSFGVAEQRIDVAPSLRQMDRQSSNHAMERTAERRMPSFLST